MFVSCYYLFTCGSVWNWKSMDKVTERSSLLHNDNPPRYAFETGIFEKRKKKLKQFQICICSIVTVFFVIAFVAAVAYTIHSKYTGSKNATEEDVLNISSVEPLSVILSMKWPLPDETHNRNISRAEDPEWKLAFIIAHRNITVKDILEENTPELDVDSPSYRHQKVTATTEKGREYSRLGYIQEYAFKYIMKENRNRNTHDIEVSLSACPDMGLRYCGTKETECNDHEPFRRYDGQCNNLQYPETYGVAYRPFRRVLAPDYADEINAPRMSKMGGPLPSARTVSLVVHRPYYRDDPQFTVMLAVWGQFLDHDMTATALSLGANGSSISCCHDFEFEHLHPECFPVILDPLDPYYYGNNVTCMEFVRSAPAPRCCAGPREQMNQVTGFIDGSVIYGSDREMALKLRTLRAGLLKMYITEDNRTLLPVSDDETDGCNRDDQRKKGRYCFMAGDSRSNENLHLTSMHLIWARHHNLLAERLIKLNPHWDDERIFQEARKIIAAQMQHITYNEFLPILFGRKIIQKFMLKPLEEGYYEGYDKNIDPSIGNSFASAAFRFAHTIIPGLMKLLANDTSSPEYVQLHKMLFDPFKLYQPGELDRALKGATQTSIEASDTYFTSELKQHLFERNSPKRRKDTKICGLDLVSLNIQRGRDHGLPGYIKWRKHCNLTVPKKFDDLRRDMDEDPLLNIQAIYNNVEDIDLYTGALSEKPLEGSIIGPTVTCLLLDQFVRTKNGDRFWYENQHLHGFTEPQLHELRKTSLARIICDNADDLQSIQYRVMEKVDENNSNVPCSGIPQIDLIYWKDDILPRVGIPREEISVKVITKN